MADVPACRILCALSPVLTLLFPSACPGPSGHSSPLLASLPIPGRPLHPPLDIKHFLTFRLNGTSPLNLFPNFNTVSPQGTWASFAGPLLPYSSLSSTWHHSLNPTRQFLV